jgi:hypothetical protein
MKSSSTAFWQEVLRVQKRDTCKIEVLVSRVSKSDISASRILHDQQKMTETEEQPKQPTEKAPAGKEGWNQTTVNC